MTSFSEREGFRPVRDAVQLDSMDAALRNSLWNVFKVVYLERGKDKYGRMTSGFKTLCNRLWMHHLKRPLDEIGSEHPTVYRQLQTLFFNFDWYDVYDMIEFSAQNYPDPHVNELFTDLSNQLLDAEKSAWRFVSGRLTKVTSEIEIAAIEAAMVAASSLVHVREQLDAALRLLSDRESPDYRNSIKDSISAVEGLCNVIVGSTGTTLGHALNTIDSAGSVAVHPALRKAFDSLYGYTSDAQGIRHALMEQPHLTYDDAKYMLVSCSAFISYLIAKAAQAGIKL